MNKAFNPIKYNKDAIIIELKRIIGLLEIKYKRKADSMEILDSLKNADNYICAVFKQDTLLAYDQLEEELLKLAGINDNELIKAILMDRDKVPVEYQEAVLNTHRKKRIETYVEKNNYYRVRIGLPPLNKDGIIIQEIILDDATADTIEVPHGSKLHELPVAKQVILESIKYIEECKKKYPSYEYLDYLAHNKLDLITLRRANNFEIIKFVVDPTLESFDTTFINIYGECREYVVDVIFNRHNNMFAHYEEFMGMMVLIMTIQRVFANLFEAGIQRDFFDLDSIEGIFKTYSVPFIDDMTLENRRILMKNFNNLLRHKATDVALYDILQLLGFERIKIHELYLTKEHVLDENGNPVFLYKEVPDEDHPGNTKRVLDLKNMYKFYFYAVDKKEPNKLLALTDKNNRKSYSEITLPDQEWIEDYELQEYMMNEEYNYVNTKYLDMNIMYKLTQMIFDASLLFKMITDKKNDIAHLKLYLPKLFPDIEVPLFDAVVLCMALIAKNNHMLGNIIWEPSKVMAVLGYNFEADFDKLRREIMNDPHMKDSRLDTMIPNVNIADYRDINTLFLKINALEEYLTKKMAEADTIQTWRSYNRIYRVLMISMYNNKIFKKIDGETAKTFKEYLLDRNVRYGELLNEADNTIVVQYIDSIIFALNKIVPEAKYLFILNDSTSGGLVQGVIDILKRFKSLTVKFNDFNIKYLLNSRYYNMIVCKDQVYILQKAVQFFEDAKPYHDALHEMKLLKMLQDRITTYDKFIYEIYVWLKTKIDARDTVRVLEKASHIFDDLRFKYYDVINTMNKIIIDKDSTDMYEKMIYRNEIANKDYITNNDNKTKYLKINQLLAVIDTNYMDTIKQIISKLLFNDKVNLGEYIEVKISNSLDYEDIDIDDTLKSAVKIDDLDTKLNMIYKSNISKTEKIMKYLDLVYIKEYTLLNAIYDYFIETILDEDILKSIIKKANYSERIVADYYTFIDSIEKEFKPHKDKVTPHQNVRYVIDHRIDNKIKQKEKLIIKRENI